jgi:hypothetical protein
MGGSCLGVQGTLKLSCRDKVASANEVSGASATDGEWTKEQGAPPLLRSFVLIMTGDLAYSLLRPGVLGNLGPLGGVSWAGGLVFRVE